MHGRWTFYDSLSGDVHGYMLYDEGRPLGRLPK